MNLYTVFFEIFGKKMKTKVLAKTEEEAKREIMGKIIFHKVEKKDPATTALEDLFESINEICGK